MTTTRAMILCGNPAGQVPRLPLNPAWLDAIPVRTSTRSLDGSPIAPAVLERLDDACDRLGSRAPGDVRAALVWPVPDGVFRGVIGSYGSVRGAPALAAFIGPRERQLEIGYLGEAVVLEATAAGLDTCWIAGAFDPGRVARVLDLSDGEVVHAVTALGHRARHRNVPDFLAQTMVRSRSRLPLETIAPGSASWPGWARAAAEAVRLAPSAKNDQPWRLRMEDGALVIARKPGKVFWTVRFDCGIAMLHAELGAHGAGVVGRWERLDEPDVARLVPVV